MSRAPRSFSLTRGSSRQRSNRRRRHLWSSGTGESEGFKPASNMSASARTGSEGTFTLAVSSAVGSREAVDPGGLGSSLEGGIIVTDSLQRGHNTLKGSVASLASSKLRLIEHCGQLAIIGQSSFVSRFSLFVSRSTFLG